jgi:hypothetical protein
MKPITALLSLYLLVSSCSKDASDDLSTPDAAKAGPPPTDQVAVPSSFTQKVMLELYSTSYCATCPDAMRMYEIYAAQYPNRVFGASVHDTDPMEISLWNTVDSMLVITQYSSGSFNRLAYNGSPVVHKTNWNGSGMLTNALNRTATCGLKLNSTVSGSTINVNVQAGFAAALTGQYRMTVYLLEDSVTGTASGYNQANYYNNISSSPFYQLGNPIIGYKHNCVVRRVLTSNRGKAINSNNSIAARTLISENFTANISGMNTSRMFVLAFIHKYGTTPTTQDVLNVQRARVGTLKNWD